MNYHCLGFLFFSSFTNGVNGHSVALQWHMLEVYIGKSSRHKPRTIGLNSVHRTLLWRPYVSWGQSHKNSNVLDPVKSAKSVIHRSALPI